MADIHFSFHAGREEEPNFLLCRRPGTVVLIRMRFEPCKVRLQVWNWSTLPRLWFYGRHGGVTFLVVTDWGLGSRGTSQLFAASAYMSSKTPFV